MAKLCINFEEILQYAHGNFEAQNKVLESSTVIINYWIIIINYWIIIIIIKKVKWSRYRPGVAQKVRKSIALLFHDRGTRRGWEVSSTPRPHFTPGKEPVPILQEAGLAPWPVWTGGKSRPQQHSIPGPSSP